MFPAYLRQAGYYTTNKSKKDYNAVEGEGVWDKSSRRASWRNRPSTSTPFFHKESFPVSHESRLHFKRSVMQSEETETSPDDVALAPYHPDTPTFRYTYARYHDQMGQIDEIVGNMVSDLEEDGLLEDTFIFYFGDHGGVLPRSKGYVYESGLHVPLVVRIPDNWKHLVKFKRGSRTRAFVSFIDFGPTLLHLAGLDVPKQVDGRPFLGPDDLREAARRSRRGLRFTPTALTRNTTSAAPCGRGASSTSATTRPSIPTPSRTTTATSCWPTRSGGRSIARGS